ncbi:MAG: copper resistance protein CopC [Candidatus Nanopelagicales bacterium]
MPAPARRRWVVVLAMVFAVVSAAPAAAHTDLISTDPVDGQTLTEPPDEVSLRFGEDLLPAGDRLVAKDADGQTVELGDSEVDGAVLSATWPSSAAAGEYRVAYRAVASDGHPLEGSFTFTIEGVRDTTAPPAESASPASAPAGGSGVNPWLPAGLVAALVVAGLLVWRSRAD